MRKNRFSEEQIIKNLKEHDAGLQCACYFGFSSVDCRGGLMFEESR